MNASETQRKQRAAAAFIARGWYVCMLSRDRIPFGNCSQCTPGTADYAPHVGVADCPHPIRFCHGHLAASNSLDHVLGLLDEKPWAQFGISCGPSRLVVVDLDTNRDGVAIPDEYARQEGIRDGWDVFAAILMRYQGNTPRWPDDTLSVLTPHHGLHLWWKLPPGLIVTGGKRHRFGWLIDIKAQGSYVPAPGTVGNGGVYKRCGDILDPAPAPGWLLEHLRITGHIAKPFTPKPRRPFTPREGADRRAQQTLHQVCDQLARAEPGNRHATLVSATFAAAHLVARGLIPEGEAFAAIEEAGHDVDRRTGEIKSAWETALMKAGATR